MVGVGELSEIIYICYMEMIKNHKVLKLKGTRNKIRKKQIKKTINK